MGVEKSIFSLQTGLLGVWANNENRLSNEIALKSEIGLDASLFDGYYLDKTGYVFVPVIRLEPRWYYNIGKRAKSGKSIKNNSSNFLALNISYHPGLFIISNYNYPKINEISFIPKWGIKRSIGENFILETGIGLGYSKVFEPYFENNRNIILDLHLRFGYTF